MKSLLTLLTCIFGLSAISQTTAHFENFNLASGSFLNNSAPNDGFASGNLLLPNSFSGGFWSGWAISATTDTSTPGPQNEYSSITGGGANGSTAYAVAYIFGHNLMYLTDQAAGGTVEGLYVTNNTYAYLSMLEGDGFAKKFGGEDGNDPDFFLLTIKKYLNGQLGQDSINFYLADYRFSNNAQDYIVNQWTYLDLSPLGAADSLWFGLTSSDLGMFGMNTPAYFCMDDVTTSDVLSSKNEEKWQVAIYPNPASESLIIDWDGLGQADFSIINMEGKTVQKEQVSSGKNKVALLPELSGAYLVVLENEGKKYSKPLIVN